MYSDRLRKLVLDKFSIVTRRRKTVKKVQEKSILQKQDWSFFSTHPNYYNIDDHGYFDDPLTPGDFAKYGDMFGTEHSGADYDLIDISEIINIINKENKLCIT